MYLDKKEYIKYDKDKNVKGKEERLSLEAELDAVLGKKRDSVLNDEIEKTTKSLYKDTKLLNFYKQEEFLELFKTTRKLADADITFSTMDDSTKEGYRYGFDKNQLWFHALPGTDLEGFLMITDKNPKIPPNIDFEYLCETREIDPDIAQMDRFHIYYEEKNFFIDLSANKILIDNFWEPTKEETPDFSTARAYVAKDEKDLEFLKTLDTFIRTIGKDEVIDQVYGEINQGLIDKLKEEISHEKGEDLTIE